MGKGKDYKRNGSDPQGTGIYCRLLNDFQISSLFSTPKFYLCTCFFGSGLFLKTKKLIFK